MSYSLDTDICVDFLNGRSQRAKEWIEARRPSEIVICSVVRAELFYGAARSRDAARSMEQVQRFVLRFRSIPFDDAAAEAYGRVRARLAATGLLIGPNDLLIAAIAVANGLTLVSHNVREFSRVEGLLWQDWQ